MAGAGATRPANRLVDVVARRLHLGATNLGVGGTLSTDTAGLLRRQPPPAAQVYLLLTGLNDARLYGASPAALRVYSEALREILDLFGRTSPGSLVVALEQPYLADYSLHAPHDRGSDRAVDAYNQRLRAVCHGLPRVALAVPRGWQPRTMLAPDTVHPNDAGHAELARAVVVAAAGVRGP